MGQPVSAAANATEGALWKTPAALGRKEDAMNDPSPASASSALPDATPPL
jgi:hypothetical protein